MQLILQFLLINILIYVLEKSFRGKNLTWKLILGPKNIIHSAIYNSIADYFSVSAHSSVTTQGFCVTNYKLLFLVLQKIL